MKVVRRTDRKKGGSRRPLLVPESAASRAQVSLPQVSLERKEVLSLDRASSILDRNGLVQHMVGWISQNGAIRVRKIYCIGIGPICASPNACFQFALLVKLAAALQPPDGVAVVDPVLSDHERQIIQKEPGFRLAAVAVDGAYLVDVPCAAASERTPPEKVLFFMPHCEWFIYEKLVANHASIGRLSDLVLVGNSFRRRQEETMAAPLHTSLAYRQTFDEMLLPLVPEYRHALSDTSMMTFSLPPQI